MDYDGMAIALWALFVYQTGIGLWAEARKDRQIERLEDRIMRLENMLFDDGDYDPDGNDGERMSIVS